jgi:hypothetical protein
MLWGGVGISVGTKGAEGYVTTMWVDTSVGTESGGGYVTTMWGGYICWDREWWRACDNDVG